jgi:hypothetical protein
MSEQMSTLSLCDLPAMLSGPTIFFGVDVVDEFQYAVLEIESEFFFQTIQELEYLLFLSRRARNFFSEFNIRLYDKNSESDYFFFPPKSEYFFQQKIIFSM